MKAILIVDMSSKYDEDIQNGRVMIDYSLWHLDHKFKAEQNFHNAQLKPIPQKKVIDYETFEEDGQRYAYEVGFNDCVTELVGEDE